MRSFYCPHCQTLFGHVAFGDNYDIRLCADCRRAVGIPTASSEVRDQPDAAREDIDAPLEPAADVVAGTGKANTLEQTAPDKPAENADLTRPFTDQAPAATAPPTP